MKRFIEGENRGQGTLLPELLDDYVTEDNPVRVVDIFVEELDLAALGFARVLPAKTGRLAYHPAVLLKLYIYGYLNRIQSSRKSQNNAYAAALALIAPLRHNCIVSNLAQHYAVR
jgi:transposase